MRVQTSNKYCLPWFHTLTVFVCPPHRDARKRMFRLVQFLYHPKTTSFSREQRLKTSKHNNWINKPIKQFKSLKCLPETITSRLTVFVFVSWTIFGSPYIAGGAIWCNLENSRIFGNFRDRDNLLQMTKKKQNSGDMLALTIFWGLKSWWS